jgi:hypothetical protein
MFPALLGLIVIVGTLLVVFARSNQQAEAHPQIYTGTSGDHWHVAYGIYICDHFVDPLSDGPAGDQLGIHTHADGVIHVHPFQSSSAGTNAQLGVFLQDTDVTLTDSKISLPDGTTMEEGKDTCDGKPATWSIAYWTNADEAAKGAKPTTIFTSDFSKIRFKDNLAAITIAFLPEGETIPPPPSIATLHNLSDVPGATSTTAPGASTSSTAPGATSSTAPGATPTTAAQTATTPTSG